MVEKSQSHILWHVKSHTILSSVSTVFLQDSRGLFIDAARGTSCWVPNRRPIISQIPRVRNSDKAWPGMAVFCSKRPGTSAGKNSWNYLEASSFIWPLWQGWLGWAEPISGTHTRGLSSTGGPQAWLSHEQCTGWPAFQDAASEVTYPVLWWKQSPGPSGLSGKETRALPPPESGVKAPAAPSDTPFCILRVI